jgi:hypothetical protein
MQAPQLHNLQKQETHNREAFNEEILSGVPSAHGPQGVESLRDEATAAAKTASGRRR